MEKRRENEWKWCLVERGRGREKWWGSAIFSLGPPQFNLSKMERKWERVSWTKLSFSNQWPTFCLSILLTFHFFFFFLVWKKISTFKTSIKAFTFNPTLLRVCLVGWILGRMKKKEWKIGEKISGKGVWMRGEGGEKDGGTQPFSL